MRKLLLLVLAAASTYTIHARQLTPDEALGRLSGSDARVQSRSGDMKLVYTDHSNSGLKGVYVFTREDGNGFIVVSADDCAQPLLGYSDSGSFAYDNIPDNMLAWLNSYTEQITYMSDNVALTADESTLRPYRTPIAPLCKTKWNQNSPFNNLCPLSAGVRTPVGCAATAMAQVLKYHNWPKQGTGSHTYISKTLNVELSFDFGTTMFDWDNMLNEYTSSATNTQKNAVATLSYACGVASDMNYATAGSAANVKTALKGMINYLNYDRGVSIQQRSWYDLYDWEDVIYKTLSENGPVMYYGASSSQSAHEFVCDGYDKDGYFHINWGWGGLSDGYFLLSALNPYAQGIGGSEGGFNLWQNAVVDICPAKADSEYAQIVVSAQTLKGEGSGSELTVEGRFNNESIADLSNVMFGVRIGDEYYAGQRVTLLQEGYGITKYVVNLTGLPEGEYRAYPAFMTDIAEWQVMKGVNTNINYLDITVSPHGNIMVSSNTSATVSLDVKDLKTHTPLCPDNSFSLTATIINKGEQEYYDDIVVILSGSIMPVEIARMKVDLLPGSSENISLEPVIPANIKPGTYSLMIGRIVDGKNLAIGMPIRVTVTAASAINTPEAESEITAVDIYTTTGVRLTIDNNIKDIPSIAFSDIPTGIYILSIRHRDGHHSTIKYIKK